MKKLTNFLIMFVVGKNGKIDPLYIIDRNRRSKNPAHKYDHVVCLDKKYGFVAKVLLVDKCVFATYSSKMPFYSKVLKSGKKVLVLRDLSGKAQFFRTGMKAFLILFFCSSMYFLIVSSDFYFSH